MRRFVLVLLLLSGPAWADDARADNPSGQAAPTFGGPYAFTEQGGEVIYRAICAGCHMQNGRGAQGAGAYPSLAADPRLAQKAFPIAMVLHGRQAMPPFGRSLTNDQIAEVVTFIRRNFGNDVLDPVVPADVAAGR